MFSAVQSYKEGPIEKCPNCGKKPRRLITSPAIHFKGSGFYKTDNRRPDSSEKSETAKKAETKSEKKSPGEGGQSPPSGKSEAAS